MFGSFQKLFEILCVIGYYQHVLLPQLFPRDVQFIPGCISTCSAYIFSDNHPSIFFPHLCKLFFFLVGTLDGFSFDSDEEGEKIPRINADQSNSNNENGDQANKKSRKKEVPICCDL